MFKAWMIENNNGYNCRLVELDDDNLTAGDVTLNVLYSGINYKDALAITHQGKIIRNFPMIPGIDLSAEVLHSQHPDWHQGDQVIVTGYGLGECHYGGLAEKARVPASWLVRLPAELSARQAMALGTAGLSAMLCIIKLEQAGITPVSGPVLVSGASGGVGSLATWILAKLGYQVVAMTGNKKAHHYIINTLAASEIIDSAQFANAGKALQSEQWAAAIDTLGSHSLANILAMTRREGIVVACGMAQAMDLPASVAPFILRGITLAGVDSVFCPSSLRQLAWKRLSQLITDDILIATSRLISLNDVVINAQQLLNGPHQGRIVVNCQS